MRETCHPVGAAGVTFGSASTTNAANGIVIDTVSGGAINVNGGSIAGATANGVNINAVFFRVFKDGDREYLTRAWLREPESSGLSPSFYRCASTRS